MSYGGIPQGWYPDREPGQAGRGLRWWDGTSWTDHVAPVPAPHLQDEERIGRWARVGLAVAVATQVLGAFAMQSLFRDFVDQIRDMEANGAPPAFARRGWFVLQQVDGTIALLIGVLFLVWFHRSAVNARALGLPARRSPAAGVVGFIVPVLNLWWPYQSTCDLFPPAHPARRRVLRWFLLWIPGGFVASAAVIGAIFVDGPAHWLLLIVPLVQSTLAALAGAQVISEAAQAHAELAAGTRH